LHDARIERLTVEKRSKGNHEIVKFGLLVEELGEVEWKKGFLKD
jgi:hypothetical protein